METKKVEKLLKKSKEQKIVTFDSVEKMEESFEFERKKQKILHPVTYWFKQKYIGVVNYIEDLKLIPYRIKCFWQRGMLGYSDTDYWRFDFYISGIIIGCLEKLEKEGNGLPTWGVNKTDEQAKKEWKYIIKTITDTFKTAKKIMDSELVYIPTYKKGKAKQRNLARKIYKNIKKQGKVDILRVMNERECRRFERGFQLFQEHFFKFWD